MTAYWRSLACQAWAHAAGGAGGLPGPVHLNLPLPRPAGPRAPRRPGRRQDWPGVAGRAPRRAAVDALRGAGRRRAAQLELPWAERGVVVCGDGDYDAAALRRLAEQAGWPVLAEPSSGARRGPNALTAYQYLLATPEFAAAHRPDADRLGRPPGAVPRRSRPCSAAGAAGRHVVIAQGPGRWADPQRAATDVAAAVRLHRRARPAGTPWLEAWRRADDAARPRGGRRPGRGDGDADRAPAGPGPGRGPAGRTRCCGRRAACPSGILTVTLAPRRRPRILASRGASGIDGTVSSAIGAAPGPRRPRPFALIGDLAFLHDAPGLALGPAEPRPDLCLVVVNNDGGGIFSTLEQAAFTGSFERLFGTPHGAGLEHLAAAFGLPYQRLEQPERPGQGAAGHRPADRRGADRPRGRRRAARPDARGGGRGRPVGAGLAPAPVWDHRGELLDVVPGPQFDDGRLIGPPGTAEQRGHFLLVPSAPDPGLRREEVAELMVVQVLANPVSQDG